MCLFYNMPQGYYEQLAAQRNDSPEIRSCVNDVVDKLTKLDASLERPGMLLGKIQSGKTNAFLGIIAKAFDEDFDIAIILTKNSKVLVEQTVRRLDLSYKKFIEEDKIQVFNIMSVTEIKPFEARKKLVFVAKKQKHNLENIIKLIENENENKNIHLRNKRFLLIDDEADAASIGFKENKETNEMEQTVIPRLIDNIRKKQSGKISFLQVTATPYSLYLQPANYSNNNGQYLFKPLKPIFTQLLPIYKGYVGGDDFFGYVNDSNNNDYRDFLYEKVSDSEQDIFRKRDARKTRKDTLLKNNNLQKLREGLINFVVGGIAINLLQKTSTKFSFVVHTDAAKAIHKQQDDIIEDMIKAIAEEAKKKSDLFNNLLTNAYKNIKASFDAAGKTMPEFEACKTEVISILADEYIVSDEINSDVQLTQHLNNDTGELKLRSTFQIFIGGQVLDRGITIPNLIGFYYGRNPKTMQQDTVLQHSRLYGNRPKEHMLATRFYTSEIIYNRLKSINEFENTLRKNFEEKKDKASVIFLSIDDKGKIRPCAPNKIKMSCLVSMKPGQRLLPVGFQTKSNEDISDFIQSIDKKLGTKADSNHPFLVDVSIVHEILEHIENTYDDEEIGEDWQSKMMAMKSAIKYFCKDGNKIHILVKKDRNITREVKSRGGRYSDAPDTSSDKKAIGSTTMSHPCLLLLKQTGKKELGWQGAAFYWPVLFIPENASPVVYSE